MKDSLFSQTDAPMPAAPGPARYYGTREKRVFDILFALLLLPLVMPVIAVLWVLAKCDGGPGFFSQCRVGQNGQGFQCWKIRTMVEGAEAKLHAHLADNPDAAAEWARECKLSDDPRITRLGGFLRRSSLDELPQIWNILKGDMSFVGPRPVVHEELARYGSFQGAYLAPKPGVTGVWQVSGRNDVDYAERVRMDVEYLAKASPAFDVSIILRTAAVVVTRTGK